MSLATITDGLAGLVTSPANVYPYPVQTVTVPCVVVGYPAEITFDTAFAQGGDRWVVPVWYITGLTAWTGARNDVSAAITSLKAQLDGLHSFGDVRVTKADIAEVTIGGVSYLSAKFECEVYG